MLIFEQAGVNKLMFELAVFYTLFYNYVGEVGEAAGVKK